MDVKDFLSKFLQFGIDKGYFQQRKVKDLPKVCCLQSEVEVIDFDKTKECICKEIKIQSSKSCDALRILPESERMDFIEFKGFRKFIGSNSNTNETKIKKHIEKFDLSRKIADSEYILRTVLYTRPSTTNEEHQHYDQTEKNFIIVTDLEDSIESIMLTLDFLSVASSPIENTIKMKLREEIENIRSSELHNIKQPQLKSCKSFDTFYQEQ